MAYEWIRLNLVKFGDLAAFGGVLISLLALGFRLLGISELFGIQAFNYFVGGMWLMLLGALIRLETLLTAGHERRYHPEFSDEAAKKI